MNPLLGTQFAGDLLVQATDSTAIWANVTVVTSSTSFNGAGMDVAQAGTFTPVTVPPRVLNADEVVRAMRREYPSVLRDAGIGGTVKVLLSIDAEGRVLRTSIDAGSGYAALDEAALAVADVIRFSPAMNRDLRVAVQVVFPVVFQVADARE